MASTQTNFYATYNDVAKVLEQFEAQERVTYVRTGLFDQRTPAIFEAFRAINGLSISLDGNAHLVPGYLIVSDPDAIAIREVPQLAGGTKFAIDQQLIKDSLYFQSGGLFSDQVIVPGKIGITYQTAVAKRLYRTFAKILVSKFSKVRSYYVGSEAHVLWQNGMRLGLSLKANTDLNLKP
jgi:hypothetical protein